MPIINPKDDLLLLLDRDANAPAEATLAEVFKAALAAGPGITLTPNAGTGKLEVSGGDGLQFTASSTAPITPGNGDFWFDIATHILYQRVTDATAAFWLDVSGDAGSGAVPSGGSDFPDAPTNGQVFVTPTGRTYVYVSAKGVWNANAASSPYSSTILPYGAAAGTATAITVDCNPNVSALTAGRVASFTVTTPINLANATTFAPDGLTPAGLRNHLGNASGTAAAGAVLVVVYDGLFWRVVTGLEIEENNPFTVISPTGTDPIFYDGLPDGIYELHIRSTTVTNGRGWQFGPVVSGAYQANVQAFYQSLDSGVYQRSYSVAGGNHTIGASLRFEKFNGRIGMMMPNINSGSGATIQGMEYVWHFAATGCTGVGVDLTGGLTPAEITTKLIRLL